MNKSYNDLRNKIIGALDDYAPKVEIEKKELEKTDFTDSMVGCFAKINERCLDDYNYYKDVYEAEEDRRKLITHLCLLRIARYLNGDWKADWDNNKLSSLQQEKWHIIYIKDKECEIGGKTYYKGWTVVTTDLYSIGIVYFKSETDAQLALGYIKKNFDLNELNESYTVYLDNNKSL